MNPSVRPPDRQVAGAHPDPDAPAMPVLLVTGVSGAGRGTVAKVLEDAGWYVVTNVPTRLVADVVTVARSENTTSRVAIVLHTRAEDFAADVDTLVEQLRGRGVTPRIVFIDASDAALVRRFEQVRRRHPLQGAGTLVEGIAAERAILSPVKERADLVVDTSALSVAKLGEIIESTFSGEADAVALTITIESFGFKYGLPIDADLVADVRFLPNPYWVPELRDKTGEDAPVRDYVLGQDGASEFLDLYSRLIALIAEGYVREGKRYMTVAVGCTGGKHRSVAMTAALAAAVARTARVRAVHRDLGRE